MVKERLALGQAKELEQKETELAGVVRALADLEGQFLQDLDLLKRGVLSEAEFAKAYEVAKSQNMALEARREELSNWLEEQRSRVSTGERPGDRARTTPGKSSHSIWRSPKVWVQRLLPTGEN